MISSARLQCSVCQVPELKTGPNSNGDRQEKFRRLAKG